MSSLTSEIKDICPCCNQPIFVENRIISFGPITLVPAGRICLVSGTGLRLTSREFDVLHLLVMRQRKVCSKETIFTLIWGFDSDTETKVVDVYIHKLRRKLGSAYGTLIHTHWGRGYSLGDVFGGDVDLTGLHDQVALA